MTKFITAFFIIISSFHAITAQTVIANYSFNNLTANDLSGNNLNGSIVGGVSSDTGRGGLPNTAIRFNGVNGYVVVPASSLLNLSEYTIHAVVKIKDFYSGLCEVNSIVWHGTQYSSNHYAMTFFDNAYDTYCGTFSPTHEVLLGQGTGSGNCNWNLSNPLIKDKWYCFTTSYKSDTIKIYVDGILQNTIYNVGTNNYSGNVPLYIGCSENLPGGQYPYMFNGVIDEIKIFNSALNPNSILQTCAITPNTSVNNVTNKSEEHISVYPNPVTDKLQLSYSETGSAKISIFNTTGQKIKEIQSVEKEPINVNDLLPGFYIIKVAIGEKTYCESFLKN